MGELLRCKVSDISTKNSLARWEIRLQRKNLPAFVEKIAGNPIRLKFSGSAFTAQTGISAKGRPSQYFWINIRKSGGGPIKNILQAHGYNLKDEILLHPDNLDWTAVKVA